jgi:exodeoxyribonuclease-3
MRIATWNVNGLRARLDYLGLWLRARRPDVVGLQELKLTDEQFPHDALAELGYRAVCHGQKAWNGVAVLVREGADIDVVQQGLPGQEDFGARLISARTAGMIFTTVYCPNGKSVGHEDFPRKLSWFDALAGHLEESRSADEALVVCGDFNICPAAIDSWNEEALAGSIFHTDDERERLRALLDWGLRDLYRESYPDRQAFSWWDYRGGAFHRGHGLRIDLVLATDALAERVEEAEIDRDWRKKQQGLTASDHAPVVIDLAAP